MILKLFVLSVYIVIVTSVQSENEEKDSLTLVHVFVRHGARYPQASEIYPKDPHKFQEHDLGQLNKLGKVNSYRVGKFLKERYGSFLGEIYQHGMVKVTSTSLARTKITALLLLAGLFPPNESERWSDEIPNWQPLPYDYLDTRDDTWLQRPRYFCPKFKREIEIAENSTAVKEILHQHSETIEYIKNNTGKNIDNLESIFRLHQLFNSENSLNLTLPEWSTQVFPSFVWNITLLRYILHNSNEDLQRLGGGRILSKVVEHWDQHIHDDMFPPNTKMLLFTVHEHNLVNLMFALGIFNYKFPNYSSAIILELHYFERKQEYAIRILYLEDIDYPPAVKKIKRCGEMCPLNEFLVLMRNVLPKNYTRECESKRDLDRPEWRPPQYKKRKL